MRRGISIVIAAGALASPSSAAAARVTYTGHVAGETGSAASFTFSAKGKFNEKGRFIPSRVTGLNATVPFTCFDAGGNVTSATSRNDLPFGLVGPMKVTKKGVFGKGTISQSPYATYNVAGTLRKTKAAGTLWAQQGIKNVGPACSTGTFTDPTVHWTAVRAASSSFP